MYNITHVQHTYISTEFPNTVIHLQLCQPSPNKPSNTRIPRHVLHRPHPYHTTSPPSRSLPKKGYIYQSINQSDLQESNYRTVAAIHVLSFETYAVRSERALLCILYKHPTNQISPHRESRPFVSFSPPPPLPFPYRSILYYTIP